MADLAQAFALSGEWGSIATAPAQARWVLQAGPDMIPDIEKAWASALPGQMLRADEASDRAALRIGPDEWLLIADDAASVRNLQSACAGKPCSLVDISHRNIGIDLSGPAAARILNAGNPLDLSDAAFPPGMATRTLYGKAEIILWRRADGSGWRIEVWRSFADYVRMYLTQAVADL